MNLAPLIEPVWKREEELEAMAVALDLRPATPRQTARAGRNLVALHEAGHAVASLVLFPEHLLYLAIADGTDSDGLRGRIYLRTVALHTDEQVQAELTELFAGAAAELLVRTRSCGYRGDLDMAEYIARRYYRNDAIMNEALAQARSRATVILTAHQPLWRRITRELLKKKKLAGVTLRAWLKEEEGAH